MLRWIRIGCSRFRGLYLGHFSGTMIGADVGITLHSNSCHSLCLLRPLASLQIPGDLLCAQYNCNESNLTLCATKQCEIVVLSSNKCHSNLIVAKFETNKIIRQSLIMLRHSAGHWRVLKPRWHWCFDWPTQPVPMPHRRLVPTQVTPTALAERLIQPEDHQSFGEYVL